MPRPLQLFAGSVYAAAATLFGTLAMVHLETGQPQRPSSSALLTSLGLSPSTLAAASPDWFAN